MSDPPSSDGPRRVALTGGIATGKSAVREAFARLGVPTIDADRLARDAVAAGTPGLAAVVARFGAGYLAPDGTLDRRALGLTVFADRDARRDLEQIVFPHVRRIMGQWFAGLDAASHAFAVAEIPLLFETGRESEFFRVVVAACRPETQLSRLMMRDHLSEQEARQRVAAQLPLADKVARADFVVETDGTHEETGAQVRTIVAALSRELERV